MTHLDLSPEMAHKRDVMVKLWDEYEKDRVIEREDRERAFFHMKSLSLEALKQVNPTLYEEAMKIDDTPWPPTLYPPFYTPPTRNVT